MLKLNDLPIPSFVKVNDISYSILPPLKNNTLSVRGRKGVYLFSQDVDIREIEVKITIQATIGTVVSKASELAEWLYYEEAVKLVLPDEPDKYYMVVPDGDTKLTEIVSVGQGTITFVCIEPFAYGAEKTESYNTITTSEPIYLDVTGNAETHPVIDLTVKEDITSIAVVSGDSTVIIGEPATVTQTPTNPKPVKVWDEMTNPATWTSAVSVDDGAIVGTFSSDGYVFKQSSGDYGTGAKWHGASAIKSLPTPIQDFEVDTRLGFTGKDGNMIGRIEVYLLDENNIQFGKVAMVDANGSYKHQTMQARAGQLTGGKYFVNDNGAYWGVWSGFNSGALKIGRRGNTWYAYTAIYHPETGIWNTSLYREWQDTSNIAGNKLAKIQIHIAGHSTYAVYDNMYFSDVKVYEYVELTPSQTPIIASSGDVLTVDCEKAIVLKNGEAFYDGINPASLFFSFKKGLNGVAISPAKADMKVTYTERWL